MQILPIAAPDGTAWVQAAPFRALVRHLTDVTGLPWQAVAVRAGVSTALVGHLLFGRRGRPVRRLSPLIASRLLSLTPQELQSSARGWVPAQHTADRLTALLAGGVPAADLARFCRLSATEVLALADGKVPSCSRMTELLALAAVRAACRRRACGALAA